MGKKDVMETMLVPKARDGKSDITVSVTLKGTETFLQQQESPLTGMPLSPVTLLSLLLNW